MRRALIAASLLCSVALPAQAADIAIAMDEVRTITFPEAVSTVYMGNPAIADVNMIDTRHAFLLGKGYGSTNMIAITKDGTQVANTHIRVLSRGEATVVLNRGTARVTYNCVANRCEATPQPGDGKDVFDSTSAQLSTHASGARTAATQ